MLYLTHKPTTRPPLKNIILSAATVLLFSCTKNNKADEAFAYHAFPITKSALGPIKVGSRIAHNAHHLKGLDSAGVDALFYHYDGGGQAYDYSYKGKRLFALMPAMDTDSIIAIMVFDHNFKDAKGITARSKAKDILQHYPSLNIYQDLLAGGEFLMDEINNRDFIFETKDDSLIAEYKDIDTAGRLKRLNVKSDWLTIK